MPLELAMQRGSPEGQSPHNLKAAAPPGLGHGWSMVGCAAGLACDPQEPSAQHRAHLSAPGQPGLAEAGIGDPTCTDHCQSHPRCRQHRDPRPSQGNRGLERGRALPEATQRVRRRGRRGRVPGSPPRLPPPPPWGCKPACPLLYLPEPLTRENKPRSIPDMLLSQWSRRGGALVVGSREELARLRPGDLGWGINQASFGLGPSAPAGQADKIAAC